MEDSFRKKIAWGTVLLLFTLTGALLFAREARRVAANTGTAVFISEQETAPGHRHGSVQEANLNKNSELQACYESFLKREPKVEEGMVEVHWMLGKSGKISDMKLIHRELEDQTFTGCLLEKIKKMTFHPPIQPAIVAHKFNFHKRTPANVDYE